MLNENERQKIHDKARNDNARDGWGFSGESFFRLIMRHKYGDDATREYVEARLEDANFHTPCALVKYGHWDAALLDFYDHHLVASLPNLRDATKFIGDFFRKEK